MAKFAESSEKAQNDLSAAVGCLFKQGRRVGEHAISYSVPAVP